MRGYDLVALCAAGSGHSGGTLSMMDIVAALYLKVANHDPNIPEWQRPRPHHLVRRAQSARACISGWDLPATSRSKTSSRCASSTRPSRDIRTG